MKEDILHIYNIVNLEIAITELEKKNFSYGRLEIGMLPIPRTARILCRKVKYAQLTLFSDMENIIEIPYKSNLGKCILSVFFSLSMKHKLQIMVSYTYEGLLSQGWKIVHDKFEANMFDIFLIGLYGDMKIDNETKDKSWGHLQVLVAILQGNVEWYFSEPLAIAITYAIKRLGANLGLFGKNSTYEELKQKCYELLYTQHEKK